MKKVFNIIYVAIFCFCLYELRHPILKGEIWVRDTMHLSYFWQVILIAFIGGIIWMRYEFKHPYEYDEDAITTHYVDQEGELKSLDHHEMLF